MKNLTTVRNSLFILIVTLFSLNTTANVYRVGANKNYLSPNALYNANVLQNGDTIEIDAANYIGEAALAVWTADNLLIKGVGGKPHLMANGEYIYGKGIWVLKGNNITVENIEFSRATVPDKNGAGIRLDGIGLTVRYCYFHDNENGILTNNVYDGDILIEYSEFGGNGFEDGYSHNLYIGHANKLTFQYNYSHHAKVGHNLKSRANENYILYNRIMDEEEGKSSRLIDLPNGGFSIVMGNLLMQSAVATNINLLGYGLEGLINMASHEIYVINNTFVNRKTTKGLFLDIADGTSITNISNNIFAGYDETIEETSYTFNNNYIDENIENIAFEDEPNFNYQLTVNSPAINFGSNVAVVNGNSLTPNKSYIHPTSFINRVISNGVIDAGAYEYGNNDTPNCGQILPINNDIYGIESYQANEIIANNTINSNADVSFIAASRIQFLEGFTLEQGAELKAYIGACGD